MSFRAEEQDRLEPLNGVLTLTGASGPVQSLWRSIEMAAHRTDKPVLITGEIGVGKSYVARLVHHRSSRASGPLVLVDCGSFSDLDNVLFGHRSGAFTGASKDSMGRLREANSGTIVLEDIERLSIHQQNQLHRVIVDGVYYPMGAERPSTVDIRFLATTNKQPDALVRDGRLQADFLSRLDYFCLHVPSLQERLEDIPLLCEVLLERNLAALVKKRIRSDGKVVFEADCWPAIQARRFPDNLRGLDKLVSRLLAHIGGRHRITPMDVEAVYPTVQLPKPFWFDEAMTLRRVRDAAERDYIVKVCEAANHNYRRVARILNISPKSLYEKLRRYEILRPAQRST